VKKLFGTDGIRGVVNRDITAELAFKIGQVLGFLHPGEKFLIARDTRESGEMLVHAVVAGLSSQGADVYKCGVLPTPAVAMLTKLDSCKGVVISASHNPYTHNGIKIFNGGFKLLDEEEIKITKLLKENTIPRNHQIGRIFEYSESEDRYVQQVVSMFKDSDFRGIRAYVDTANGASYRTTPMVLQNLGINVTVHYAEPNGKNINKECGSLHPQALSRIMENADIGILHDGDADRCIIISEDKREVNGDKIMGLLAPFLLEEGRLPKKTVVGTVMSNLGLEQYLKDNGILFLRTHVGDKYVLQKMLQTMANLGGERSGHIIFLDRSTTGDGLITALEFLRLVVKTRKSVSELSRTILDFPQITVNVEVKNKSVAQSPQVIETIESLQRPDTRIIVRPSGTENVVRITVEGNQQSEIENIAHKIAAVVYSLDRSSAQ